MSVEAKITTTVRLKESTKHLLDISASLLDRSHSSITEEALSDFFTRHNLNTRYQMHVSNDLAVLAEIRGESLRIHDVQSLNGKTDIEMQREYSLKLRTPVTLIKETP